MAGHDVNHLEVARNSIAKESPDATLRIEHLDLASLDSVRSFTSKVANLSPIDVLINNAGASRASANDRSPDGFEMTFAVNHLGPFLLTHLLLSAMATRSRVIFVASGAHDPAHAGGPMIPPRHADPDLLAYPQQDRGLRSRPSEAGAEAYSASKLCNILSVYEFAARSAEADGPLVTFNAFDPGLMAGTGLGRHGRGIVRFMWFHVMPLMSRFISGAHTPAESAADLVDLSVNSCWSGTTGQFFRGTSKVRSSELSYDASVAARLWRRSVEFTGLRPGESPLADGGGNSGANEDIQK
jgi:NAD(P)-dependent dehydrogenase (short-subunit alcohol dehydrogenase family)